MGFRKESLEQLYICKARLHAHFCRVSTSLSVDISTSVYLASCPVLVSRLREFAPEAESNLEMNISPNQPCTSSSIRHRVLVMHDGVAGGGRGDRAQATVTLDAHASTLLKYLLFILYYMF